MAKRPAYKASIDAELSDALKRREAAGRKATEAQKALDAAHAEVRLLERVIERAEEMGGNGDDEPVPVQPAPAPLEEAAE